MVEFLYQFGSTVRIFTEELASTARCGFYRKRFTTARTGHRQCICIALRIVLRNLRDDHICFINLNGVPNTKLKIIKDVQIVQICTADCRSVNFYRFKQAGDTHHAGTGCRQLYSKKLCFKQLILPFQSNQAVLMVSCSPQAFPITDIIIFHDKPVYRIVIMLWIHQFHRCLNVRGIHARQLCMWYY